MSALARAEREYFEQPGTPDVPNHHTDVVCPFNPAALCSRCGQALARHLAVGDDPKDLHSFLCPTNGFRGDLHFDLADGEDLGCPHATDCSVCDKRICIEHSTEFTTCLEGTHHIEDCALACRECTTTTARTHP